MIITCNNCNKRFNVDSVVIPEKGRLLQCSACNHSWFFRKKIVNTSSTPIKNEFSSEITEKVENVSPKKIELFNIPNEPETIIKKISTKDKVEIKKSIIAESIKVKKNQNILGKIIVFIISFIALIILLDTFQNPIGNILPNVEFLLYNLYESIKDLLLFFKDLI